MTTSADAADGPDAADAPDAPGAPGSPGIQDGPDTADALGSPHALDAADAADAPGASDVADAADTPDASDAPDASDVAEAPVGAGLRSALGTPRTVKRLASSPRSLVWLVEFDGTPAIVKQITGGADAPARYARELTALRLAARAQPPVVPEVLGTDPEAGILVLEHLASKRPGPDWAADYATALARLHATTTTTNTATTTTTPTTQLPRHAGPSSDDAARFLGLADQLGVRATPAAAAELDALCARLQAGSDTGSALLHGDPCPGNDLHTGNGVRFVDLESACLGDGLTELAYLRIGFPTCWCVTSLPEARRAEAERAYREQWRVETGREPAGDLADACAGWLIQGDALVQRAFRGQADHLAEAVRQDWRWGTTTARGRLLHRTAVVAELASPALANFGRMCGDLHQSMLGHWPEAGRLRLPAVRTLRS